jgi:CHASE1-domain containing sensor protein
MSDLPHIRRKWQPIGQFWPILAAGRFGLVVAISAWFAVSIWEERLARATFNDVAGDYAEILQNGLDEYVGKLLAVRAFYEASIELDPDEFALFTGQILDGQTDRMRVIWCPPSAAMSAPRSSASRSRRGCPTMPSRAGR